jgi:glutamine synthetase
MPGSDGFLSGILERAVEITAFANPIPNSYARLGGFEAPGYVSWSRENRSQLVRIPATTCEERRRIEIRSPDPSCNPYLVFALLIHAGLDGMEKKLVPPKPLDLNLYKADADILEGLPALPANLKEALDFAGQSEFIRRILPGKTLEKYQDIKLTEWDAYRKIPDREKADKQIYFGSV